MKPTITQDRRSRRTDSLQAMPTICPRAMVTATEIRMPEQTPEPTATAIIPEQTVIRTEMHPTPEPTAMAIMPEHTAVAMLTTHRITIRHLTIYPNNNYPYNNQPPKQNNGLSIASLVLGIVGIVACCIPIIGIPVNVTGLILGIVGMKKGGKGMAIAGIILCSIFLVLTIANSALGVYINMNYRDVYDFLDSLGIDYNY